MYTGDITNGFLACFSFESVSSFAGDFLSLNLFFISVWQFQISSEIFDWLVPDESGRQCVFLMNKKKEQTAVQLIPKQNFSSTVFVCKFPFWLIFLQFDFRDNISHRNWVHVGWCATWILVSLPQLVGRSTLVPPPRCPPRNQIHFLHQKYLKSRQGLRITELRINASVSFLLMPWYIRYMTNKKGGAKRLLAAMNSSSVFVEQKDKNVSSLQVFVFVVVRWLLKHDSICC